MVTRFNGHLEEIVAVTIRKTKNIGGTAQNGNSTAEGTNAPKTRYREEDGVVLR